MYEKHAHGKKNSSSKKECRQAFFCNFTQGNHRLQKSEHQSEISESDHVDMRVHFRAAVLEEISDILKRDGDAGHIARRNGLRGSREASADAGTVLMQDEDRENVAENHARKN